MFNLPWNVDMTPGRLVAPMSVRRTFQASPQWFANNPGAMDAVGEALLNQNAGVIQSWLQAQRQNARNATMLMWTNNLVLPGITAQYWNYAGNEILRLIATPENVGGTVPGSLTINPSDVIDVKADFNGWPIPGEQHLGIQVVAPGWAFFNRHDPVYWYDFGSIPSFPDVDGSDMPANGGFDRANELFQDMPGIQYQAMTLFVEGEFGYTTEDDAHSVGFPNYGFVKDVEQDIKAGSKVVLTPLKAKQYWEVQVLTVPTDVPPTAANGIISGPIEEWSEVLQSDGLSQVVTWPPELNSWTTPCIGVMPGNMLLTKGDTTPAILGLEKAGDDPRSVWVTRIAYSNPIAINSTFANRGYYYIEYHPGEGGYPIYGAIRVMCGANPVTEPLPNDIIPTGVKFWFRDQYSGNGDDLYWVENGGDADVQGPAAGQQFIDIIPNPGETLPARFQYRGSVDGPVGDLFGTGAGHFVADAALGGTWRRVKNTSGINTGRPYMICDLQFLAGDMDDPSNNIPPGAQPGQKFSPVFKGRWDLALDATAIRPDAEPSLADATDSASRATGFWTGVELGGEMAVNNTIMIATDMGGADSDAHIWFGRNDQWYGPNGQMIDKSAGLTPENATAKLDIVDKTGAPVNFYAAVSWRMGPFEAKIVLGAAQKFSPPSGFDRLTKTPSFTIPLPDRPA